MARVILRSRHVTRDGERETNGGKRKGERKEDSGGHGESSVGTFWYQKSATPKLLLGITPRDFKVPRKEREERDKEKRLPLADRSKSPR